MNFFDLTTVPSIFGTLKHNERSQMLLQKYIQKVMLVLYYLHSNSFHPNNFASYIYLAAKNKTKIFTSWLGIWWSKP